MNFEFSTSNCSGFGLWTDAAEIMNALNIRHNDNEFKLLAPTDFNLLTLNVTWTFKDSANEEIPGSSEDLLWIYSATGEANNDYTHSIQSVGGEEISIPWNIPDGTSILYVSIAIISSDNSSYASGNSSIDMSEVNSDNGGNSDGTGEDNNNGADDGGNTGDNTGGNENDGGDNEDSENSGDDESGNQGEENQNSKFIYPVGVIERESLPVSLVGYQGFQNMTGFSHVQIIVAEIREDGTVGGIGHVWQSSFFPKDVDMLATLESLIPICDGKELTNFNVSYHFTQKNEDDGFNYIDSHIVGVETTVTTFSVKDVELPLVSVSNKVAYCLDPVILIVNRQQEREIQHASIKVNNYIADFEFFADRNILEIDLAEYLQTLFANVNVFEHQQISTTILIELFDDDWNTLHSEWLNLDCVYGKIQDPGLPNYKLRVQWLDKYGVLHDEYFKIIDNTTEGESKQKYVVSREEREEKTGEKSITLAKVLANNAEREALKTIVFADHVRAYIGDSWKRVRIANSYKVGAGREKKNFEITIKYSL